MYIWCTCLLCFTCGHTHTQHASSQLLWCCKTMKFTQSPWDGFENQMKSAENWQIIGFTVRFTVKLSIFQNRLIKVIKKKAPLGLNPHRPSGEQAKYSTSKSRCLQAIIKYWGKIIWKSPAFLGRMLITRLPSMPEFLTKDRLVLRNDGAVAALVKPYK